MFILGQLKKMVWNDTTFLVYYYVELW